MPFSCLDLLDYIFSFIISGIESALDEVPSDFLSYTQARLPWPECLLKPDSVLALQNRTSKTEKLTSLPED